MSIAFTGAVSANISMLQEINRDFGISQKRVSTGKKIFGAADDATRYRMSETMLGRSRQIESINNNISLTLKTLQATDNTLQSMTKLVESAQELIRKAQAEGAASVRGATPTANISGSTVVAGAANGSRLQITSDGGKTYTYTFGVNFATTTWGDVANALNSEGIGVIAEFVPSTVAGQTNIRFRSTNGKDFTFNGTSDENVMGGLTGLSSPNGQVFNATNQFANGIAAAAVGEVGYTIGYGGGVTSTVNVTAATAVAINSTLVFKDSAGGVRTLTYTAASNVATLMGDINAMNAGIKAELVNTGAGTTALRLRNIEGGNAEIVAGTGAFMGAAGLVRFNNTANQAAQTSAGVPLSTNTAARLALGQQYDAIVTQLNLSVANNPVQAGRNLLAGQNMNVVMDEFAGNPLTIAGINITAAGTLTMAQAGNTWTTDANIQTSATQANQALTNLRDYQSQFATFNSYMKSRYDMNSDYSKDLQADGNDLVAADVAEESAKLAALQTQQQFAVQAFTMGSQTQQALLRLLG